MRLTERAHQHLEQSLRPGDLAIDATAGNGHDCLKIAQLVAPHGQLIAIDRQAPAIDASRDRLGKHKLEHLCRFIEDDHANALRALAAQHSGEASAVVFNLGYLPGSDKSILTQPASTLPALDAANVLLKPGGILLVTAYRGHQGGMAEAEAVARWMKAFPGPVACHEPDIAGGAAPPPILWVATASGHGRAAPGATPENHPPPAGR